MSPAPEVASWGSKAKPDPGPRRRGGAGETPPQVTEYKYIHVRETAEQMWQNVDK